MSCHVEVEDVGVAMFVAVHLLGGSANDSKRLYFVGVAGRWIHVDTDLLDETAPLVVYGSTALALASVVAVLRSSSSH